MQLICPSFWMWNFFSSFLFDAKMDIVALEKKWCWVFVMRRQIYSNLFHKNSVSWLTIDFHLVTNGIIMTFDLWNPRNNTNKPMKNVFDSSIPKFIKVAYKKKCCYQSGKSVHLSELCWVVLCVLCIYFQLFKCYVAIKKAQLKEKEIVIEWCICFYASRQLYVETG